MKVLIIANSNLSLSGIFNCFKNRGHDTYWGVFEKKVFESLSNSYDNKQILYKEDIIKINPNKLGNKYFYLSPGEPETFFLDKISPDIVITDVTNRLAKVKKRNEFRVNVFHSFCYKNYVFHESNQTFDMLALPSKWWQKKFEQYIDISKTKLSITGYHKHELIKQSVNKSNEIKKRLKIPNNKKIVLYAPSWGGCGNLVWGNGLWPRWDDSKKYYLFEKFTKLINKNNAHLIVKLHHLVTNVDFKLLENYDNITIVRDHPDFFEDPHDYIAVSDLLISDVSGIIFEFGILNRPIIIINPDNINVWKNPSIPIDYLPSKPIECFSNFLEILDMYLKSENNVSINKNLNFNLLRINSKNINFFDKLYSEIINSVNY